MAKKKKFSKGLTIAVAIVVFILGAIGGFVACSVADPGTGSKGGHSSGMDDDTHTKAPYISGELEIHFLELGNKYTGDCTYIRAGDTDILIDAGSKTASIPTIQNYLSEHMTDNVLEYVIVTHAHEDHYAGFATPEKTESLFDLYECEVVIDFSQITSGKEKQVMYQNYQRELQEEIDAGATHYTARECMEQGKNLFDLGNGIQLEILDSYFYYNPSSTENNHSVCTMIHQGEEHYLFTGDLEKEGEEKLVEMNRLPQVSVYKAGHHGSKTSSHNVLLDVIQPEIVCVCCCCGSPEYTKTNENQFPTQDFIDRISRYTDRVYVTTLCVDYDNGKFTSMNGNIVICVTKSGLKVNCSNGNTPLKDTDWFRQNRTCPESWKKAS